MQEATQWRRKASIKWAGVGDTSSPFFFHAINARRKCEAMTCLFLDDNMYITDDKLIMAELVRFYKDLFLNHANFIEHQPNALQHLLCHTQSTLSSQKIKALEKKPTNLELRKALLLLAKGKSSWIDGLTLEVYRSCLHLIKDPYFTMIQKFWETREGLSSIQWEGT